MRVPVNTECPDCKGIHVGSDFDCTAKPPQKSPCESLSREGKEDMEPIQNQEQGRIMTLEEAISMIQRANEYLKGCDWSSSCLCGSCYKCAVQRLNREISFLQDENKIYQLRKTDERIASETIFRLRSQNEKMREALEKIKNSNGCGCSGQFKCQCLTEGHLKIWREEAMSVAEEVLKGE